MSLRQRNFDKLLNDSDLLSESQIKNIIPNLLYKYTSINEFTKSIITNNELWYSKPSYFNDPFDCKVNSNFGKDSETLKKNLEIVLNKKIDTFSTNKEWENLIENDLELANKIINDILHNAIEIKFGILCLSEYCNSPLMWAHYSNSHKGICLEFETHKTENFTNNIIPVQYYNEYPSFNFKLISKKELSKFFLYILSSKGDDWDYEFEWRVLNRNGGGNNYKFDKKSLKSVIFGIKTPLTEKKEFIKLVRDNDYQHTEFYQSKLGENKYEIMFEKINVC